MADCNKSDCSPLRSHPRSTGSSNKTVHWTGRNRTQCRPWGTPVEYRRAGTERKPAALHKTGRWLPWRRTVTARSAYGLWLERNIAHATLVESNSLEAAYEQFAAEELEAVRRAQGVEIRTGDVLLLPDGVSRVLDRDDLERARAEGLDPALAALAEDGLREVLALIAAGHPPFSGEW